MGYRKNQTRDENIIFWNTPPRNFRFVTLTLEIPEKKSFQHPWKFSKIMWHPLVIPGSKSKTHRNSTWVFIWTPLAGNSASFLIDPILWYSQFWYRVTNDTFLMWMFFTPLWRTIKSNGQAGIGREDRPEKRKRNNLKLPSFCAVFNCSNRADWQRKTNLITVFLKVLKIMAKKAWNFQKGEGKIS